MFPAQLIQSGYLSQGLFGQILVWCLEVLPYLEKNNLKPQWRILSKHYGSPPAYNIFPEIISLNYKPDVSDTPELIPFEQLKRKVGHPRYNFQFDFQLARQLFFHFFKLPMEVLDSVDTFFAPYDGQNIVGLHYRGTDKLIDPMTNPVSEELFLQTALDLIREKKDIDLIFLASDEEMIVSNARKALPLPVISFPQKRKHVSPAVVESPEEEGQGTPHINTNRGRQDFEPLFRGNEEHENITIGRNALIDSLLLSRCRYLLKCHSALSGWSKIWNPKLEAYRVAAFKADWFPDAFIPLYQSSNRKLASALLEVQKGEMDLDEKLRLTRSVSSYLSEE